MGFDFNVEDLFSGSLFHGTNLAGLYSASLEITHGAVATHATSLVASIGSLNIGTDTGSGTFNLEGAGQLSASVLNVGFSAIGTFTQSGGTNSLASGLVVGLLESSSGTYNMSGTSQLTAHNECIGIWARVSSFSQVESTRFPKMSFSATAPRETERMISAERDK